MKRLLLILLFIGGVVLSSRADVGWLGDVGRWVDVGWRGADKDSLQPVRVGLTKIGGVRGVVWSRKLRFRFYNDLATVSARLKLYPLAMKCYYNAMHVAGEVDTTGLLMDEDDYAEEVVVRPATGVDGPTGAGGSRTGTKGREVPTVRRVGPTGGIRLSQPIDIADLLAAFEDGKEAASYAILAEVKQPVSGKRRSFTHINNVGHMFITLIKYNRDKSIVCRSFGFYPHKSTLLSATPFCPRSPSVFRDDAGHDWDEAAGKFISARRFRKIVEILRSYDHRGYDLNHNNCTDFGLTIAQLGGIGIAEASGRWPFGKGNNPGSAGQSMLEGKVSNIDEGDAAPLFVSTNLPAQR
jgi:hypothetical protein